MGFMGDEIENITVFNSSSFAVQSLMQDLKAGNDLETRKLWLASLVFGARSGYKKIRRVKCEAVKK